MGAPPPRLAAAHRRRAAAATSRPRLAAPRLPNGSTRQDAAARQTDMRRGDLRYNWGPAGAVRIRLRRLRAHRRASTVEDALARARKRAGGPEVAMAQTRTLCRLVGSRELDLIGYLTVIDARVPYFEQCGAKVVGSRRHCELVFGDRGRSLPRSPCFLSDLPELWARRELRFFSSMSRLRS